MARAVDPGLAGTPECSQPIPPAMLRTRYERVLRRIPGARARVSGSADEGQPRGRGRGRAARWAGPPRRHEVVQQATELATGVHVAIGPHHERQAAVAVEAAPDPASRQPERDHDPDDQAEERDPDDPLPRVLLGDQQRVVAEAAELDGEVGAIGRCGLAAGQRHRAEADDVGRAVGVRPDGPEREHEQDPRPVARPLEEQLEGDVAAGDRELGEREPGRRVGHRDRPGPQRLARLVADDDVGRRPEPVLVERVAADRQRVVDPDRLVGHLLAVLVDREVGGEVRRPARVEAGGVEAEVAHEEQPRRPDRLHRQRVALGDDQALLVAQPRRHRRGHQEQHEAGVGEQRGHLRSSDDGRRRDRWSRRPSRAARRTGAGGGWRPSRPQRRRRAARGPAASGRSRGPAARPGCRPTGATAAAGGRWCRR